MTLELFYDVYEINCVNSSQMAPSRVFLFKFFLDPVEGRAIDPHPWLVGFVISFEMLKVAF